MLKINASIYSITDTSYSLYASLSLGLCFSTTNTTTTTFHSVSLPLHQQINQKGREERSEPKRSDTSLGGILPIEKPITTGGVRRNTDAYITLPSWDVQAKIRAHTRARASMHTSTTSTHI